MDVVPTGGLLSVGRYTDRFVDEPENGSCPNEELRWRIPTGDDGAIVELLPSRLGGLYDGTIRNGSSTFPANETMAYMRSASVPIRVACSHKRSMSSSERSGARCGLT